MVADINECLDSTLNDCDGNATCADIDGSYNCTCNEGYIGNGTEFNCFGKSSDNQVQKISIIPLKIGRTMLLGVLTCRVFVSSTDFDECGNGTDNCHSNATCINEVGSFQCICKKGFDGDGVNCEGKNKNNTYIYIFVCP